MQINTVDEVIDGVFYVLKRGDKYLARTAPKVYVETDDITVAWRWHTKAAALLYSRRYAQYIKCAVITQIRPNGKEIKRGEPGFWQSGRMILQSS